MKRALLGIAVALCAAGLVLRLIGGEAGPAASAPEMSGSIPSTVPAATLPPEPPTLAAPPPTQAELDMVAGLAGPFVEAVFTRSWQDDPASQRATLRRFATDRFIGNVVTDGATGADLKLAEHEVSLHGEADPSSVETAPGDGGTVVLSVDVRLRTTGTYETGEETWLNEFRYVTVWRNGADGWKADETVTWSGQ